MPDNAPLTATGLPANIHILFKLYDQISQELNQKVEAETSLSLSQYQFLHAVLTQRSATLSDIAKTLGCTRGNVTGLAERLIRRSLIERTTDPDDKRRALIQITPAGQQLVKLAAGVINAYAKEIDLNLEQLLSTRHFREPERSPEPFGGQYQNQRPGSASPIQHSVVVRLPDQCHCNESVVVIRRQAANDFSSQEPGSNTPG